MQVITKAPYFLLGGGRRRLMRRGRVHTLRFTAANVLSKLIEARNLNTSAAAQFSFPFGEDLPHRRSEKSTALFSRLLLSFHNVSMLQMFLRPRGIQYI